MNLQSLIPKDKYDEENNVEKIIALGYPAIELIIPQLLEWIQDPNWPVAIKLSPFLFSLGEQLAKPIQNILVQEKLDPTWKWSILMYLDSYWNRELIYNIKGELIRIQKNPTIGERNEELNGMATELLKRLDQDNN